ncbi:Hypothetical protein NTJ_15138 [Nesidiocoris tenuis]|uniref:Uncharacterized protein n=1 Tax=Nesidiocoris tenuis TaxID=355587 RepID=A0ABN7BEP1_9HEMI|nr:Hypothetical protein NTJ_15138 [Nesidiocoris tenuis]
MVSTWAITDCQRRQNGTEPIDHEATTDKNRRKLAFTNPVGSRTPKNRPSIKFFTPATKFYSPTVLVQSKDGKRYEMWMTVLPEPIEDVFGISARKLPG